MTSRRRALCGAIVAAGLILAGCDGRITTDLATDPPADRGVSQVSVNLQGLEFRKSDGGAEALEFSASEPLDLMDLQDGNPLRMFTEEELPEGSYTGVRLLFDPDVDATLVRTDGNEFPVSLAEGDYAEIDFTVAEDDSSRDSLTLTLDLRQSLSFDDGGDDYTLTPVLRSVRTDEASEITGTVDVACPSGTSLAQGGSVYLFAGENVTPDDRDDTGIEPYATASVELDSIGQFGYRLLSLPEGAYTFALTCRGDEEDAATNDDLDFQNIVNLDLDPGATLTHDVTR